MQFIFLFIIFLGLSISEIEININNNNPCYYNEINNQFCYNGGEDSISSLKVKKIINKKDSIKIYNKEDNSIIMFSKFEDVNTLKLSFPTDLGRINNKTVIYANVKKIDNDTFLICGNRLFIDNTIKTAKGCFVESVVYIDNSEDYYYINFGGYFNEIKMKANKELIKYI